MSKLVAILTIGCAYGVLSTADSAAPSGRRGATAWQLDVRFHDPQRLVLRLPGDREETAFWYLLYEVTNNTGRDRQFYPSVRLVTDTLKVVEAGADINPLVYDVIAARHKREFPFFAPPAKVTGLSLQGKENARATVAVFRDFDREASSFTIYASGFSGEIDRVANPAFDVAREESDDNPRFFTLRRTLVITYDFPGDPDTRERATPIRRARDWVMR